MLTDMMYNIDPFVTEELPYTLEEGVRITVDWLRDYEYNLTNKREKR